jgi:hypothetical protein
MIIAQELSLMVLDLFDHTGQLSDIQRYAAIPFAVVEGFRQRFPKINATTGKTDMFPAQVGALVHVSVSFVSEARRLCIADTLLLQRNPGID